MSQLLIADNAEFPSNPRAPQRPRGYLVVIEAGEESWGAYVPDLPGVVAAAESEEEVETLIAEAVEFHIEGLRAEGEVVPPPTSRTLWVTG